MRPIKNMSGGSMFAEVFFDDVRVPVENRLGEEGQGWQVTVSALAHERSSIAEVEGLRRKLEELKELARKSRKNGRPALEDDGIRRRIARFEAKIEGMRFNGMRALTKQLKGEPLGAETSINKLLRAELEVALGEIALEMQGSARSPGTRSGRRSLAALRALVARSRDRRRHAEHPEEHHRRARARPPEGLMNTEDRVRRIEALLREQPRRDRRAGHRREPQAPRSRRRRRRRWSLPRPVVSPRFAGLSPVQSQRLVYEALGDMMTQEIHALDHHHPPRVVEKGDGPPRGLAGEFGDTLRRGVSLNSSLSPCRGPSPFSLSHTKWASQSSRGMLKPAALRWPPPPKLAARLATSKSPIE